MLWVFCGVHAIADEPVPPLVAGGDEIELSPPLLGRPEVLRGTIDELAGESVMLRTRGC
jgi:hypothetical protein